MIDQINEVLRLLNHNTQHVRSALIKGEIIDKNEIYFPVNKEWNKIQTGVSLHTNHQTDNSTKGFTRD